MLHGESESYSNEQFESLAESKNIASSNEDKIVCFVCKQHIPKSQALNHHAVCKKMAKPNRLGDSEDIL